LMGES